MYVLPLPLRRSGLCKISPIEIFRIKGEIAKDRSMSISPVIADHKSIDSIPGMACAVIITGITIN